MGFDYTLDASAVKELAAQNVHIEKHADRTVITFRHDVELTSTGKDDAGKSLTCGKTPGRRVNIGSLPDGRGVWLQTHLACWKQPRQPKASNTAADVAALRDQVAQLTRLLTSQSAPQQTPTTPAAPQQTPTTPAAPQQTSADDGPRYPMPDDDEPAKATTKTKAKRKTRRRLSI